MFWFCILVSHLFWMCRDAFHRQLSERQKGLRKSYFILFFFGFVGDVRKIETNSSASLIICSLYRNKTFLHFLWQSWSPNPQFFFAQTNLLVIWNTSVKIFLDSVESSIFCARRILENSTKPRLYNVRQFTYVVVYLTSSHSKSAQKRSRSVIGCCNNIPDLRKIYCTNYWRSVNGTIKTLKTSELSLWEPWKNSHWNLFPSLSNVIFRVFCLKPTSNFEKCYRKHISSNPVVYL